VLALGSGITLLGVLRSLGASGFDVTALPDADRMSRRSRWYRAGPPFLSGVTPATFAERVGGLPSATVLIPCSDVWARTLAALAPALAKQYPVSVAPIEVFNLLEDKQRFAQTLDRLSLPHPTTRAICSVSDLESVSDSVIGSSFLKPAHSQQFFARFGVKAFRVKDRSDASAGVARAIEAGFEMLLQEYVPGPPTNHYFIDGFIDRHGTVTARFARRRLRMDPPDFGNSTLMVSIPMSEVGQAAATLDALLVAIQFRGIFSAEFKRDARDGVFKLIEVNARPWWYIEFAARCGVNVAAMAVSDALGKPVTSVTDYKVGRRCVVPYYDFRAARREHEAARLSLSDWVRSWIGAYQPVFRLSDPLPVAGEIASLVSAFVNRLRPV